MSFHRQAVGAHAGQYPLLSIEQGVRREGDQIPIGSPELEPDWIGLDGEDLLLLLFSNGDFFCLRLHPGVGHIEGRAPREEKTPTVVQLPDAVGRRHLEFLAAFGGRIERFDSVRASASESAGVRRPGHDDRLSPPEGLVFPPQPVERPGWFIVAHPPERGPPAAALCTFPQQPAAGVRALGGLPLGLVKALREVLCVQAAQSKEESAE